MADARLQVIADGEAFNSDDIVVLHQVASGATQSATPLTRYQYSVDGSDTKTSSATLAINDTVVRSRIRPTAYVIPKDIPNAEKILYILDNQGAEYYELAPGSTANLKQYYYVGEYTTLDRVLKALPPTCGRRPPLPLTREHTSSPWIRSPAM